MADQVVVPKAGWYYGLTFKTGRVVTQGDPLYPTVFNILFDTVVVEVRLYLCGLNEAQHRMG